MSTNGSRGRGRGSEWISMTSCKMLTASCLERTSRPNTGPPEPYRSQSMAVLPEKFHPAGKENAIENNLGRKPSADEQRKSTSRSSTGRARSTRGFRETIRSAVPDTSIITMAKRPDRGGTGHYPLFANWDWLFFVNQLVKNYRCIPIISNAISLAHWSAISMILN